MVDIFQLDCLNHEHIQRILKILKTFRPDFDIPLRSSHVNNRLLNEIYRQKPPNTTSHSAETHSWWEKIDLHSKLNEQVKMEVNVKVKIQSINTPQTVEEKLVGFLLFIFSITKYRLCR